ncbi:MAG TPA: DUF3850 domain-containing protein [Gaiellaceae bacterium]|nr:DUF3850 domain-containing protein [Gaiellaceae bacterium]
MTGQTMLNRAGNVAYVHRLKCWADNFDAIARYDKRAEVRTEEDRKFKAGDLIELTRTDVAGVPTEPRVRLIVEILHVDRMCGPLEICASPPDDGGGLVKRAAVAVLSLDNRATKITDAPATPAAK